MDDDGNRKIDLVEFKRGLRDYGGTEVNNSIFSGFEIWDWDFLVRIISWEEVELSVDLVS